MRVRLDLIAPGDGVKLRLDGRIEEWFTFHGTNGDGPCREARIGYIGESAPAFSLIRVDGRWRVAHGLRGFDGARVNVLASREAW